MMSNILDSKEKEVHIVGIEWDGQHPPTKWYRRLDEWTGGIRSARTQVKGGKEVSSIERRYEEGAALVLQEGMIICSSYDLAKKIAIFARDDIGDMLIWGGGKRPTVYLGEARVTDVFVATDEDRAILDRIEGTLSKKGKKPKAVNYVITCLECMRATDEERPRDQVINCPYCGSMRIHWRPGRKQMYLDDGCDIVELWKRTRFAKSHWEPGMIATLTIDRKTAKKPPPIKDLFMGGREGDTLTLMDNKLSEQVYLVARRMADVDREAALDFLDSVLVGRTYQETRRRTKARIRAATKYFEYSNDPQYAMLAELPDRVDVLDAAIMLGSHRTANLIVNYLVNHGAQNDA
jgi:DNA-directed RNA polymerase subunit RPC12/RpoP